MAWYLNERLELNLHTIWGGRPRTNEGRGTVSIAPSYTPLIAGCDQTLRSWSPNVGNAAITTKTAAQGNTTHAALH